MSQGWPTREQAVFLAHAVSAYRASFMSPYNLVGSVTRGEFWDRVMDVYFEHFPVPESMSVKDVAAREVVSNPLSPLVFGALLISHQQQIKNYIIWRAMHWIIWP
jgi:hypothetical protein